MNSTFQECVKQQFVKKETQSNNFFKAGARISKTLAIHTLWEATQTTNKKNRPNQKIQQIFWLASVNPRVQFRLTLRKGKAAAFFFVGFFNWTLLDKKAFHIRDKGSSKRNDSYFWSKTSTKATLYPEPLGPRGYAHLFWRWHWSWLKKHSSQLVGNLACWGLYPPQYHKKQGDLAHLIPILGTRWQTGVVFHLRFMVFSNKCVKQGSFLTEIPLAICVAYIPWPKKPYLLQSAHSHRELLDLRLWWWRSTGSARIHQIMRDEYGSGSWV